MRSFLTGRWMPAAVLAPAVLLLGGGAFAIAAGGGGSRITACVHHNGGGLYAARHCAKHDKKLTWNVAGPRGLPGQNGGTGPQGPGAVTFFFDGTASATPTRRTLGTVLGDTIAADCFQPAAGEAELRVYLQTTDGSWTVDFAAESENNGTTASSAGTLAVAAGGLSSPFKIDDQHATAAPDTIDRQLQFIQLGPQKGSMIWHENATTNNAPVVQTCHLSVQAFPSA